MSPEITRYFYKQALKVVDFYRGKGIAHRDLRSSKLIVNAVTWDLVFVDFWFAEDVKYGEKQYWGDTSMMPPEMVLCEGTDSEACDIFALAKIFFILYTGVEPFAKAHPRNDRMYYHLAH